MSMRSIEIYWQDLTPEKQAEIMEVLGDTGNYDVFPIATVDYEEDADMAGEAEDDGEINNLFRITY